MVHSGENIVDGVPVEVERKRVRRISIRVKSDGRVAVSVPKWGATLDEAEAFLRSKWRWVLKVRAEALARPPSAADTPPTEAELSALSARLGELTGGEGYCDACFSGRYATPVPEDPRRNRFEQRLSETGR